jgi:DNA-binding transcriptional ArsR family regulator
MADWTFLTNYGLVLAAIAKRPRSTAREIGDAVGVTERAAHKIIKDLDEAGYITKTRVGRQNHYRIHSDMPLKDDGSDAAVGELLVMLGAMRPKARTRTRARQADGH